ncbi:MAG TPA: lipase, partial [Alcanivorax sp.]|nr:lipase [Alcanivorax sp.]
MGLIIFLLALAIFTTVSITLLFYMCWFYDRRSFPEQAQLPGEQPLRLLPTVVGIIKEAASLTVLVFSYPLRLIHDASPVRSRHHGETPVILVHGYGGNSANFLFMQWRLKWRGWGNVYSVSYTPPHINARKLAQQVT